MSQIGRLVAECTGHRLAQAAHGAAECCQCRYGHYSKDARMQTIRAESATMTRPRSPVREDAHSQAHFFFFVNLVELFARIA